MAEIKLPSGDTVKIDDADLWWLSEFRWRANGPLPHRYAVTAIRRQGRVSTVPMHRLIAGPNRSQVVDHINGDTLDNRKANLRVCSALENSRNRALTRTRGGAHKGVRLHNGKWNAAIMANRTLVRLGRYACALAAAWAYDEASIRLHGEFGRLNFDRARDWIVPSVHGASVAWPPTN